MSSCIYFIYLLSACNLLCLYVSVCLNVINGHLPLLYRQLVGKFIYDQLAGLINNNRVERLSYALCASNDRYYKLYVYFYT